MRASLDHLKDALPVYLDRYHRDRITRSQPGSIHMRCPFHRDKHPSFSADNRKGTWLFKCFSCQASGSILDLHAHSSDHRANSRENIESTAQAVGLTLPDMAELTPLERKQWRDRRRQAEERERKQIQQKSRDKQITSQIKRILESKLAPYISGDWQADLWDTSPIRFDHPEAIPHDFIRTLFKPDDILWLGFPYDTGEAHHAVHFRTCKEWLKLDTLPPRIAAGTFHQGSISRSLTSVKTAPFIIIESDELIGHKPTTSEGKAENKALSSALIGYAQDRLGLTLRAVIDTGNKSLHAWMDRPPPDALAAIKRMAAGLRIDRAILDHGQAAPLRMPHCIHEKTNQPARLLYLNPITQ